MKDKTAKQARYELISRMRSLMTSDEYLNDDPKAKKEIQEIDKRIEQMELDEMSPVQRLHHEIEKEIGGEG